MAYFSDKHIKCYFFFFVILIEQTKITFYRQIKYLIQLHFVIVVGYQKQFIEWLTAMWRVWFAAIFNAIHLNYFEIDENLLMINKNALVGNVDNVYQLYFLNDHC